MVVLSRAQEREERRKMGRGMSTSIAALILCWVPVLGFLLSAVGFISVVRCITRRHRVRHIIYTVISAIMVILCAGVLMVEIYTYSRNPNILNDAGTWLLAKITGQSADDSNYLGGEDYTDEDYPGMGLQDELFSSGYYDADGNFIPYPDEGEGDQGEDADSPDDDGYDDPDADDEANTDSDIDDPEADTYGV